MSDVSMTVNGKRVSAAVEDRTLLVHFLRENLGLTGTHVGCDTSQCGACVVHVDGKAVKSCTMLAAQASGSTIVTIEGLADGARSASGAGGLQGASRPAVRLLHAGHDHGGDRHDRAAIRKASTRRRCAHELEGNICRCTGYHNIVKAILAASRDDGEGRRRKAA